MFWMKAGYIHHYWNFAGPFSSVSLLPHQGSMPSVPMKSKNAIATG